MSQPSSPYQRQLFVLYALALLAAGKLIQPCLDWDSWWHLAVGRYLVEEHRLPEQDPFSQLGYDEHTPWIAYSWLYELLLYQSFRFGGAAGVLALRYLLVMLSWGGIAWFLLNHARDKWLGLLLLALVSISLRPFSPERPWHFTIFFTTLTLHAVIRVREGVPWRRFWWLPIVYAVWANVHIQFVMGFVVLGLAWLSALGESFRGDDGQRFSRVNGLFLLGLASALATLLTPFHYRLYRVIWEYATQTKALGLVMELRPPNFLELHRDWFNWPLVALVLWACVTTAMRGFRIWDLLLLASAVAFSVRMQRDLWYGVLAASAVVLHERRGDPVKEPAPATGFSAGIIAVTALAAVALVVAAWEIGLSQGKTVAHTHEETYPVKAAEFVRESRLPGPLFNNFDWGGYLIWALPEYPVSIDGRTNLYGENRLLRSFNAWNGEGWEDFADLLRAGVIIAPKKRGGDDVRLTDILRQHPERWQIKYEDDTAVVFVPARRSK